MSGTPHGIGFVWTPEEHATLLAMVKRKASAGAVAKVLGRTRNSVLGHAKRQGIYFRSQYKRPRTPRLPVAPSGMKPSGLNIPSVERLVSLDNGRSTNVPVMRVSVPWLRFLEAEAALTRDFSAPLFDLSEYRQRRHA